MMLMKMSQHSQVSPLPDILLWEVYHLCLVSRSLGFEPPEEELKIKTAGTKSIREVKQNYIPKK